MKRFSRTKSAASLDAGAGAVMRDPTIAAAVNDAFNTNEASSVSGNLLADNGSGPDTDSNADGLVITAVNGSTAAVGTQITLPSGALLTVNSNGTFTYNPNGAFDSTPAAGSGASNTTAINMFTYTLDDGSTATVTIALAGLDSNDLLFGTNGIDNLSGGAGNDQYVIVNTGDIVNESANNGFDTVSAFVNYKLPEGMHIERLTSLSWAHTTPLVLTGNTFVNLIEGNAGANEISGGGGADTLVGFGGDDIYIADTGASVIEAAGQGNDVVYAINDHALVQGSSVERLSAIDWNATTPMALIGNTLANKIDGNNGNNLISGGGGSDTLFGFRGDDAYIADSSTFLIKEFDNQGNDVVYAITDFTLFEDSSLERLSAIDWSQTTPFRLTGNRNDNLIEGNAGNNQLNGNGGADVLVGFGGDDLYFVDSLSDRAIESAGAGFDIVYAFADHVLAAGSHVERLSSISWATTNTLNLTGNELANTIEGNAGQNRLDGGGGNDVLNGFGGADTFAFTTALGAGNVDVVADFQAGGIDRIGLDDAIFTGLAPGALAPGAFVTGSAAQDGDDRIIYNAQTGALLFDVDGNGAAAAVQFATLTPGLTLGSADFIVI